MYYLNLKSIFPWPRNRIQHGLQTSPVNNSDLHLNIIPLTPLCGCVSLVLSYTAQHVVLTIA